MLSPKKNREFMEAAVDEMMKSRAEHQEKSDPKVGAVLVDEDGNELGRTHRGAIRDGNHAEYQLIERMHGDKSLEGATIYVTLEPCIKRTPPKQPCAKWIAEARINRTFVGMTDPNPDISGRGIQYLLDHGVQVYFFDLDLIERITAANKEFIDYCESTGRVVDLSDEFEGPSDKERESVVAATLDDLCMDTIKTYLDRRGVTFEVPSNALWEFMWKNGFLNKNDDSVFVPTVAGVLLFAKCPEDLLPQSKILIEEHVGSEVTTDEITGPLLRFRDKIDSFFRKGMRTFTEIQRYERVAVEEYPVEALREAFFNAVVHRDYRGGWRIQVSKQRDGIVIRSPGLPLRPITLSRMNTFDAPPFSRNPRIAVTFHHMKWVEERARGLRKIRDLMVARGLRPPVFRTDGSYLVVTFIGQEGAWQNVRVQSSFLDELEPLQQDIVRFLMDEKRISTKVCADRFGVEATTARRHLKSLMKLGVVESKGAGSRIHYVLAGN
jgi:ATP-dependent DNA helicase RecG